MQDFISGLDISRTNRSPSLVLGQDNRRKQLFGSFPRRWASATPFWAALHLSASKFKPKAMAKHELVAGRRRIAFTLGGGTAGRASPCRWTECARTRTRQNAAIHWVRWCRWAIRLLQLRHPELQHRTNGIFERPLSSRAIESIVRTARRAPGLSVRPADAASSIPPKTAWTGALKLARPRDRPRPPVGDRRQ